MAELIKSTLRVDNIIIQARASDNFVNATQLILKYPRNQRLRLNFLNTFIGPYRVPDTCVPIDNITTKL
jgi:hypothetical protein